MSDLVERLQSHMGKADMGDVLRDCRLAADRIEALEEELGSARAQVTIARNSNGFELLMRDRIGRLEAALREYESDYCEGWCRDAPSQAMFDCGGCRARAALAPEQNK